MHPHKHGLPLRLGPIGHHGAELLAEVRPHDVADVRVGDDGGIRAVRAGRVLETLALGAPGRVLTGATGDFALMPRK